jgi:hypothetical protein
MRISATVAIILMTINAIPMTKNIELKTKTLSVLPILPDAIPITAQLIETALLRPTTL